VQPVNGQRGIHIRTNYGTGGAKGEAGESSISPLRRAARLSRMLSPDRIGELHRLHFVEKLSLRKIARHMRIGRRTIVEYLEAPAAKAARAIAPANSIRSSRSSPSCANRIRTPTRRLCEHRQNVPDRRFAVHSAAEFYPIVQPPRPPFLRFE